MRSTAAQELVQRYTQAVLNGRRGLAADLYGQIVDELTDGEEQ